MRRLPLALALSLTTSLAWPQVAPSQLPSSQVPPSQVPPSQVTSPEVPATASPAATAPVTPPRKGPPGWKLRSAADTDDPVYCRMEFVPNSRFQKERCLPLSLLMRQQVLDRKNREIGVPSNPLCAPNSGSWCKGN